MAMLVTQVQNYWGKIVGSRILKFCLFYIFIYGDPKFKNYHFYQIVAHFFTSKANINICTSTLLIPTNTFLGLKVWIIKIPNKSKKFIECPFNADRINWMGGFCQTLSLEPFGLRIGILKASKNYLKVSLITDAYLFSVLWVNMHLSTQLICCQLFIPEF